MWKFVDDTTISDFDASSIDNVSVVEHAKILGLIISDSLQWNHNVNHIIEKANKCLYIQSGTTKTCKNFRKGYCDFLLHLYQTHPRICFKSFYHSLPKYLSDDIERVQKRSLAYNLPRTATLRKASAIWTNFTIRVKRITTVCKTLFSKTTLDSNHKLPHYCLLNILLKTQVLIRTTSYVH